MQTLGPTTRYLCPLECGWHHDAPPPTESMPGPYAQAPGETFQDMVHRVTTDTLQKHTAAVEQVLATHLATHPASELMSPGNPLYVHALVRMGLRALGMIEADADALAAAHQKQALEAAGYGSDFTESRDYQVVGDWGVDSADDEDHARRKVARILAAHPDSGARADWRTVRTWDDDAQYYGPWQPLSPE